MGKKDERSKKRKVRSKKSRIPILGICETFLITCNLIGNNEFIHQITYYFLLIPRFFLNRPFLLLGIHFFCDLGSEAGIIEEQSEVCFEGFALGQFTDATQ